MAIPLKARLPAVLLLTGALGATGAQAQAQKAAGMEERLRTELRNVTAQLQQARAELAQLKAAPAARPAPAAPDGKLKQELAQSRAQLAEARAREQALAAQQRTSAAAAEAATASAAQYRQAGDQLAQAGRAAQAERQRLDAEVAAQRGLLAQCASKNAQLYATGKEILQAYESLDVVAVMRSRQPFAAQSRVKLEQIAQQHGDQLYQGVFDARTPVAAPEAAATAQSPQ